jgi:hypothetical protein
MTETTSSGRRASGSVPKQSSRAVPEPTGWVGWLAFAGTMMVIVGCLHAIQGFIALFQDEYYLVGKKGLTVHVDYTAWGWTYIIAGLLIAFAGGGVWAGKVWARTIGVILAAASLVLNFGFMSAYPVWSSIVIAIDVFVIWALIVHGREAQSLAR